MANFRGRAPPASLVHCAMLAAQACAVAPQGETSSASSSRTPPDAEVAALWERTAIRGRDIMQTERTRCYAVVNIALTMTQQASTVEGSHR